jgi:hypothetical protein
MEIRSFRGYLAFEMNKGDGFALTVEDDVEWMSADILSTASEPFVHGCIKSIYNAVTVVGFSDYQVSGVSPR